LGGQRVRRHPDPDDQDRKSLFLRVSLSVVEECAMQPADPAPPLDDSSNMPGFKRPKPMTDPKPPKAVSYAVTIGVVLMLVHPWGHPLGGLADAVGRVVNTVIGGVMFYGLYHMRRWAVWTYLLLTLVVVGIGVAKFGVIAWRGLIFGVLLRTAIVMPSLFYWKRLR
jgi:hypothetical protein